MMASDKYPSTWEMTSISDVVYFQEGPGLRKFQYREEGVPFLNIQTLENERVNKEKCKFLDPEEVEKKYQHFLLETNDIVCSSSGTIGKTAVIREEDKPLMLNTSVIRFRPWSPELFSRKYLHIFLKSQDFISQAMAASTGSAQINFGPTHLKTFVIPVPPLNEQKRIVAKIEELFSELDNGIASLKTAREQLKVYRQAVLKHAFEGKLTAKWREENADKLESPEQLLVRIQQEREASYQRQLEEWKAAVKEWDANGKDGKKPGRPKEPPQLELLDSTLPIGWLTVSLNWLLTTEKKPMTTGPFGTALKKSEHQPEGVPVLGIENIGNGKFFSGNKIFVTEEKAEELAPFKVHPGDIVISRSGTVGEICEVPEKIDNALISTNLLRVSLDNTFILSPFFVLMFQGGNVKLQVKDLCKGSSREFLNQSILSSIKYPVCGLEEQKALLEQLEMIFANIEQQEKEIVLSLEKAETLRQSILKKAFSGQLVPQDPSDEPASELLARIQAEKEFVNTEKAKKTNKIHSSDGH